MNSATWVHSQKEAKPGGRTHGNRALQHAAIAVLHSRVGEARSAPSGHRRHSAGAGAESSPLAGALEQRGSRGPARGSAIDGSTALRVMFSSAAACQTVPCRAKASSARRAWVDGSRIGTRLDRGLVTATSESGKRCLHRRRRTIAPSRKTEPRCRASAPHGLIRADRSTNSTASSRSRNPQALRAGHLKWRYALSGEPHWPSIVC